ncbi:MAG: ribosylpyrimidine nucleosidase [Erysipelotrichaceae bacterium]|nr:ribosylpyrimidine nucleosidase [Erysipelotrichaceae bacterium]
MGKVKMILDCDTGHDDAIALMLAASHPDIDLLGVTVVAGNQILERTLNNTLNVCDHLGLDVPVYRGMPLPLVREQFTAGNVHGESGLDGPVFGPRTKEAEKESAVSYIIKTLMKSDGDITLVPVGPLTNIAVAMRMEPNIIPKIKSICMMGGAYGTGNMTPSAEFNIYADPEAAYVVFNSGVPITMMGLDLTNQALATMDIIERMEAIGNKAGKLFGDMMRFTLISQKECFDLDAGPVHDVTAVAYLVAPEIFRMKSMFVEVDINRGPCYGRTVCDTIGNSGKTPNARVGIGLDLEKFWDLVEENLRRLD